MTLITVTDNATVGQAKHRYATVLMSKTANNAEGSSNANNNSSNGNNANNNVPNSLPNGDSKKTKQIDVVAQRLWAFRPNF